ncbi:hypothetical protein CJ255_07070 [Candidatus Viridilinea mediisalina]|uniref:Uncharacterized protein n=1 Tax=Candidatus Viridilinea mediisalina TaxID=2024553 RepID=A0A2A6RLE4_9CHLR|nr:hypothetical protein CJ255_07070 [Candidatus Viridilinea mediisalina]
MRAIWVLSIAYYGCGNVRSIQAPLAPLLPPPNRSWAFVIGGGAIVGAEGRLAPPVAQGADRLLLVAILGGLLRCCDE